jgi:hypothetical protein
MDQSYGQQVTSVEIEDLPSTYLSDKWIEKEFPVLLNRYNGMLQRAANSLVKTQNRAAPSLMRYWEEEYRFWLEKKEDLINHISNK